MKCDHCDQPATVHVTHVVNGKVMKAHLCQECAQKLGVSAPGVLGVADALLGPVAEGSPLGPKACSTCGMTLRRFQKEGRLGCPDCYRSFEREVKEVLRSLHGRTEHVGRRPGTVSAVSEAPQKKPPLRLHELRTRLDQAIAQEAFEDAARLRDEIRMLQEAESPEAGGEA